MNNNTKKRLLAWLMAFTMMFSVGIQPVQAFAAEEMLMGSVSANALEDDNDEIKVSEHTLGGEHDLLIIDSEVEHGEEENTDKMLGEPEMLASEEDEATAITTESNEESEAESLTETSGDMEMVEEVAEETTADAAKTIEDER